MKHETVIKAMHALNRLAGKDLPVKSACAVHRLRVLLRPVWEFHQEEETKLMRRLMRDGAFIDDAAREEWNKRIEEMSQLEAEGLEITPIALPLPEDVTITANDVDALEGFVNFE